MYLRSLSALIFNYGKPIVELDEKYRISLMVCTEILDFGKSVKCH